MGAFSHYKAFGRHYPQYRHKICYSYNILWENTFTPIYLCCRQRTLHNISNGTNSHPFQVCLNLQVDPT